VTAFHEKQLNQPGEVMKQTDVLSHGRIQKRTQGWNVQSWAAAAIVAACLVMPIATQARSITQVEFIQHIVNLSGDSARFTTLSSPADYVSWAASKGMVPTGGWKPNSTMTKEVLAETLVQLFDLNPKKYGGDLVKNLLREGIVLPSDDEVSREDLMKLVDQDGFAVKQIEFVGEITDILPPGLAKQGKIPPGWTKKDGTIHIPPGLAKKGNR
jgi:hypothetical protein